MESGNSKRIRIKAGQARADRKTCPAFIYDKGMSAERAFYCLRGQQRRTAVSDEAGKARFVPTFA